MDDRNFQPFSGPVLAFSEQRAFGTSIVSAEYKSEERRAEAEQEIGLFNDWLLMIFSLANLEIEIKRQVKNVICAPNFSFFEIGP